MAKGKNNFDVSYLIYVAIILFVFLLGAKFTMWPSLDWNIVVCPIWILGLILLGIAICKLFTK